VAVETMTDGALIAVRVVSVGDRPDAAWAEGRRFSIPADVPARLHWTVSASGDLSLDGASRPASASDAAALRERAAFTDRPPVSARLPVSYQIVPGRLRAAIGSAIGRWHRGRADRWAAFPGWPLDLSADLLSDLSSPRRPRAAGPAPVVLTHDIDSPEGLRNLVAQFLPLEEAVRATSTSYIVPCAWDVDEGLATDVTERGHDIGVHGYDHSNATPFARPEERRRRLDAALTFAKRHGSVGYRAPSLLRTRGLLRDLAGRYHYDSSIPTSGGLFPVPNNGCATARPFTVEGIRELPLSLPRDGSLRFLGHSPDEIAALWIDCADHIARSGGVVVLLTHCERRFSGDQRMLSAYRRFLEYVGDRPDRFAFRRASDVVDERAH
jgi:peptidoglycan/xylan/chitin deacetylase (PgdA/CDA1 family)